jgi:hypothetical protein
VAPGVTVSGTTLYIVGGNTTSDNASVNPAAGSKPGGTTGLAITAKLNGVSISKSYIQTFTAIVFAGYAGNETLTLASTLERVMNFSLGADLG